MTRKFISILAAMALSAVYMTAGTPQRISLEGRWEFRQVGDSVWRPADVPGCVHTDLLSCGLIEDPFYGRNERSLQWIGEKDWEYRKTFHTDNDAVSVNNGRLVMEGVDTYAYISINGLPVGETDNMFRTWVFDIGDKIREGENEIVIRFESVFRHDMPKYLDAPYRLQAWPNNDQSDIWLSLYARKAGYHYGWDWGPRLITAGIWKPIYIEGWDEWKLEDVHFKTRELKGVSIETGRAVKAEMEAEATIISEYDGKGHIVIECDGKRIHWQAVELKSGSNRIPVEFDLKKPELWWSNGTGKASMTELEIVVHIGDRTERIKKTIGIRTVEVIRENDGYGRSMYVRLNGHDIFCKGANWIPIDNFPDRRCRKDYISIIDAAAQANMNMLRVWGGGLYEDDMFYEACDSLGIMVWQDMAFACGMFPSDDKYIEGVQAEVRDNVRRLRNHPSLVLWCGNNENEISYFEWGWNRKLTEEQRKDYEAGLHRLFHAAIPDAIRQEDDTRYYHHSSPSTGYNGIPYSMGDAHFWSVWKGGWVEEYLKPENIARFMSEYGFISYPDMHSLRKFIPSWDMRSDSPSVLAHHRAYDDVTRDPEFSNKMIRRYLNRYAWVPEDFEDFVYMTQWFQAEAVKVAMEAHRRAKPYCMGTLFWQINDCWPSVSWSSIDYYGRWKALHHYAQRAYAPVLVSPYINSDGEVSVKVISDRKDRFEGTLEAMVSNFKGDILKTVKSECLLEPDEAGDILWLDKEELDGDRFLYVRLVENGQVVSHNTFFSRFPNEYDLPEAEIRFEAEDHGDGIDLTVSADCLARGLYLYTDNEQDIFEDNYIDLVPGFPYRIHVKTTLDKNEFITTLKYKTL